MSKINRLIVVGGGASGLMAAASAASLGVETLLIERKAKLARKLAISGKGRCNLSSALEGEQFMQGYPHNAKFLYSAFSEFSNLDLIAFFEGLGVKTKVERGFRVFPCSDSAEEVVQALEKHALQQGVKIISEARVKSILKGNNSQLKGVQLEGGKEIKANAVILACGGLSYPGTGSSGDGFKFARELGHQIIPLRPSLVPLIADEKWLSKVQGLSLKNVRVKAFRSDAKKINEDFGEMLFTHYGVSGPIILSMSRDIAEYLYKEKAKVNLNIDLKAALSQEELVTRIKRDFTKYAKKILANALNDLLPKALIPVIIELSALEPQKVVSQMNKKEIEQLASNIKKLCLTISACRPVAEAIVTAGGVDVKEIEPRTMQSKLIQNLYFAGEMIDVDAYTGGFNLQAAFSTGYLAGKSAAQKLKDA